MTEAPYPAPRALKQPRPSLLPNTLHEYWVVFEDSDIDPLPVIAWHPEGHPMVVDGPRGLLVQAMAIGDIKDITIRDVP